jgi:hypothetical protein
MQTTTVEIRVDIEGGPDHRHLEISARGSLAASLRSCILRLGEHFTGDPEVQRLVDAVAAVPRGGA